MKKKFLFLTVLLLTILTAAAPTNVDAKKSNSRQNECLSPTAVQVKDDLRHLWVDHVVWTRNYIVSAIADLEDQDRLLQRLLKNQEDIGNSIKPFYGEEAGNQLTQLLTEHIVIAGKLVEAAKNNNQQDFDKFNKDWYRNADDIVAFLNKANPNWPKKDLTDFMYMHLQLLTDNVVARLKKDWDMDVIAFEKGELHFMKFADFLTEGLMKQFPKKFK